MQKYLCDLLSLEILTLLIDIVCDIDVLEA